jgi:nitrogenase molybdenum-iron protein alpha/beta subunit
MFPHAAGMIASNGPHGSVKDIYNIKGLTENDKRLFKKYGKEFTTNLPARRCMERINN